ncbi:MAG: archaeal proteasome endopeptidase complex subunit beta [Candidatus Methanomethylicaceae archaeon]
MPEAQIGFPPVGATTVGIVCKDGIVLASEKRISYGYSIMSKAGKKVFLVNERIGVAFAGLVSDAQAILRRLGAEVMLYELDHHKRMSVRSAAKLLANILYSQRYYPVFTETIIGGVDEEGNKLFVLDQLGSLIEDKFAALGTGGAMAISVIEGGYKNGIDVSEGKELAVKAVRSAISRDVASGDGIDVVVISKDGAKEEFFPAK